MLSSNEELRPAEAEEAMASITLQNMERNGHEFKLTFEIRTTHGPFPFSTTVPDAGSPSETERNALLEMKETFQEVLAALQGRLAA